MRLPERLARDNARAAMGATRDSLESAAEMWARSLYGRARVEALESYRRTFLESVTAELTERINELKEREPPA